MTTVTGNTVLMWWPRDVAILSIGIPHSELITKYCPHARLQGIARLDGHRLVIRRPADLAVGKVRTRPDASFTCSTGQSTEDATSTSSATLVSSSLLSLPRDSTANDNDTYSTNKNNTNNGPTVGPSTLRQRSTIPSPDLDDSASLASIASSSTAVSDSQLPNQNPNQDQDHNTQVWGLVYLLTPTEYRRFQEQHLLPSTPRGQPQRRPDQPRQRNQPQLRFPRIFRIPIFFTRQRESQTPTRTLPEVQVRFFQQDILRQSAARQQVFPGTTGNAVYRHLNEVVDLRLVRVLVRAGEDPDPAHDAVAEALFDAINTGDGIDDQAGQSLEAREQAGKAWRQQRDRKRRGELADGLASWFVDLREMGVPNQWLLEVMEGMVERFQGLAMGEANANAPGEQANREREGEELLEFLTVEDVRAVQEDARDLEGQLLEAVDTAARAVQAVLQGASRQVMGFARRGFEALAVQFTGEENRQRDEGWEMV